MISTTYVPLEKEVETVDFDDEDVELTGRKIIAFRYKGVRHEVSTWKQMIEQVCTLLYEEQPTDMDYLATQNNWVYNHSHRDYSKISERCYVYSSCSTATKVSGIKFIFAKLNIPTSTLEFDLVPVSGQVEQEDNE